jgi:hypothetical protein
MGRLITFAGSHALQERPEALASKRRTASETEGHESLARDIHLLFIAVEQMENFFDQLQYVRDDDAALDRGLMMEGHLISAQIVEAQEVVRELYFAANGAKDAELMARARVILGPLGRKLDRLAGYIDRRKALLVETVALERGVSGERIELPEHPGSH